MKAIFVLTWLVSLSIAMQAIDLPRKKAGRPVLFRGNARMVEARVPEDAPEGYTCSMGEPTQEYDISELERLPSELIEGKRLRTRQSANDFFQCFSANPPPTVSDCEVVLNQVYSTGQSLLVSANACLVFNYNTCSAFFCALCDNVQASTDFIANQLITVMDFCVEGGEKGVVVGTDPPQWDAGFSRAGDSLPWFDVC